MKKRFLAALATGLFLVGISNNANALSVTDVQLNGQNADGVSAVIMGNDNKADLLINDYLGIGGSDFTFIVKDDLSSPGPGVGTYDGVTFTLLAPAGELTSAAMTGEYDLGWTGTKFPLTIDLAIVLKASDRYAIWFFNDELLPAPGSNAPGDYWNITYTKNNNFPQLSHMAIFGRDVTQVPVPEPATMLLFGTGLAGLAAVARRRKN